MRWLPAVRRASSTPMSKSSRCTRIIASASGYRREDRDLVHIAQRVLPSDIVLVDGDAHHRQVAQRLGIAGATRLQPAQQPGHIADFRRQRQFLLGAADARAKPSEIEDLHPSTSKKGRKSTMAPGARLLVASSRMTRPSDCTIEDRMPAPSRGYLTATKASPSRRSRAR